MATVDYAGNLQKVASGLLGRKQDRYFELRGTNLFYWTTKPDTTTYAQEAAGCIDLRGAVISPSSSSSTKDEAFAFQIGGPQIPRNIVLFAPTPQMKQEWVKKLTNLNHGNTSVVACSAIPSSANFAQQQSSSNFSSPSSANFEQQQQQPSAAGFGQTGQQQEQQQQQQSLPGSQPSSSPSQNTSNNQFQMPAQNVVVDCSGFLHKIGGGVLQVKQQRYFELRGTNLYYWKNRPPRDGQPHDGEAQGLLDVRDATVGDGTLGITLTGSHLKKVYQLFALNAVDKTQWLKKLSSSCAAAAATSPPTTPKSSGGGGGGGGADNNNNNNNAPPPPPDHSGNLLKLGGGSFLKHNQQRYFELRGHLLCYWKSAPSSWGDKNFVGSIDLRGAQVFSGENSFTLTGPYLHSDKNNKTYVLFAGSDEQRRTWMEKIAKPDPSHTTTVKLSAQPSEAYFGTAYSPNQSDNDNNESSYSSEKSTPRAGGGANNNGNINNMQSEAERLVAEAKAQAEAEALQKIKEAREKDEADRRRAAEEEEAKMRAERAEAKAKEAAAEERRAKGQREAKQKLEEERLLQKQKQQQQQEEEEAAAQRAAAEQQQQKEEEEERLRREREQAEEREKEEQQQQQQREISPPSTVDYPMGVPLQHHHRVSPDPHHHQNQNHHRQLSPSQELGGSSSSPPPLVVPYNLRSVPCPTMRMPHSGFKKPEKSPVFPDIVLDNAFWEAVLVEFKEHNFPSSSSSSSSSGGQLSMLTADEMDTLIAEGRAPLGCEKKEFALLSAHWCSKNGGGVEVEATSAGDNNDEHDNSTAAAAAQAKKNQDEEKATFFDAAAFRNLLEAFGTPCTIDLARYLLLKLPCYDENSTNLRIRCETACYALRAIHRVVARKEVGIDLAAQAHALHQHQQQLQNNNSNNSENDNTRAQQQQQQQQEEQLHLMLHPGVFRPVVTPISAGDHHQHHLETATSTSSGTGRRSTSRGRAATTPKQRGGTSSTSPSRASTTTAATTTATAQPNENNNSDGNNHKRTKSVSPMRTGGGSRALDYSPPESKIKAPPPRTDDQLLLTPDVSGVMCTHSPFRSTLKVQKQIEAREKKRHEEEAHQAKMDALEDAKRLKYGMKPRNSSRSPARSEHRHRSPSAGSTMTAMTATSSSVAGGGGGAARQPSPSATSSAAASGHHHQHHLGQQQQHHQDFDTASESARSHRSMASTSMLTSSSSSLAARIAAGSSRYSSSRQQQQPLATQIHTFLPMGESHAALMRARQMRADGADTFLSQRPRNGLVTSSASLRVERDAVVVVNRDAASVVNSPPSKLSSAGGGGGGVHQQHQQRRAVSPSVSRNSTSSTTASSSVAGGGSSINDRKQVLWNSQAMTPVRTVWTAHQKKFMPTSPRVTSTTTPKRASTPVLSSGSATRLVSTPGSGSKKI